MGDRPLSPPQRATGLVFFLQGLRCKFEKKSTHWACHPMGGRPGYIFKIFENGYIFLKFYFFLNIKKKKPRLTAGVNWAVMNKQPRWTQRRSPVFGLLRRDQGILHSAAGRGFRCLFQCQVCNRNVSQPTCLGWSRRQVTALGTDGVPSATSGAP